MEISVKDFDRCCRCCLAMVDNMKPLFGACLNVMLMKLMNLQATPTDRYPQQMCSRCILKLSSAYTFSIMVLKNQETFEEILKAAVENGESPAIVADNKEKQELNTPKETTTPKQKSSSINILPSVNNGRSESGSEDSTDNEESYQCSQCKHRSKDEKHLKIHLQTHLSAKSECISEADVYAHLCNICGARFRWRTSLHKHLRQHRARRRCAHCARTFAEAASLRVHLVSHSLDQKPYRCGACGRAFTQPAARDKHARRHGGAARPQLPCDQCDKSFLHKYSLQRHRESAHAFNECTICRKLFTGKKLLDIHMRYHKKEEMDCSNTERTTDNIAADSINVQTVTVEFLCLLCSTKFQTRESLEVHICTKEKIT